MNANRVVNRMAIAAIVFGGVTVLTGGRALFGRWEWRGDFGNAVPFLLWFNFLAGMVYILAGAGLLLCRRWAVYPSLFVAGPPSRGGPVSFSFHEATSPMLFHPSCAISTAPNFLPREGHPRGKGAHRRSDDPWVVARRCTRWATVDAGEGSPAGRVRDANREEVAGRADRGFSFPGDGRRGARHGPRGDGKKQATFRGYPLYYWGGDKAQGDTAGQGVNNVWYVIDPANFPPKM